MNTAEATAVKLFGPERQYRIPLFQRHYVWGKKFQWEPLWNDLKEYSQRISSQTQERGYNHFTGAIVLQQLPTSVTEVPKFEIIDGQQRLTTFQIILCAIRDIGKANGHVRVENYARSHIRNTSAIISEGEEYKLIPTEIDIDSFKALVDEREEVCEGKIRSAYEYFRNKIAAYVNGDEEKALSLALSLLNGFGFVEILIKETDEPAKIFESLNARGKSLLQFDLLRNNLFLRTGENRDGLYTEYWKHFEHSYWDPEVNAGTSCELFLQHFLMAKLGSENVKPEFNTYQDRYYSVLKRESTYNIKQEFSELKRYSDVYVEMTDCDDSSEIGQRMKFYQIFGLTTLHPFILFLICEVRLSGNELNSVFHILESYTLRRMLCCRGKSGLKKYNIFFSQLISELKNDFTLGHFIERLSQESSNTLKYPTDDDLQTALHSSYETDFSDDLSIMFPNYFPNNMRVQAALQGLWVNSAGAIKQRLIRYILYRIELQMRKEKGNFIEPVVFTEQFTTLEHILPQAWKKKWDLPISNIDGDDESRAYAELFSDDYKEKHPDWETNPSREGLDEEHYSEAFNIALARDVSLESIGNLTIVTKELNSKLGNHTFSQKRKELDDNSNLLLNKEICHDYKSWDVNEIHTRAERLITYVCKIWPSLGVIRDENL